MLLKGNTSMQPVKCEIQCCLPFLFNCNIMETANFPSLSLDISKRFHQGKKNLQLVLVTTG